MFRLTRLETCARQLFGLAAIVFGVTTFIWHDASIWQESELVGNIHVREVLASIAALLEIVGGLLVQRSRTAKVGAVLIGAVYLVFALLRIPTIVAQLRVYNNWNSFFEQFAQFVSAFLIYALCDWRTRRSARRLARTAYVFFGISVLSFTLEQVFYLSLTASLVPKWIPPGQMFWAVATTVAFGLAALALLSGLFALPAARLLAIMLLSFQFLIWIPALFADPHKLFNWSENAENLSIAASAWIVSEFIQMRSQADGTIS